jgi:hypothetical protein
MATRLRHRSPPSPEEIIRVICPTVPTEYKSAGLVSLDWGSCCSKKPTLVQLREACRAAATDLGRPMVMVEITPGNKTVSRIGTRNYASSGSGGNTSSSTLDLPVSLSGWDITPVLSIVCFNSSGSWVNIEIFRPDFAV